MTGRQPDRDSRGSALVMAMFVMVLLTGMGIALLALTRTEARMGQATTRTKKTFYLAEAGLEDGRMTLFLGNGTDDFTADLQAAANGDPTLDFDIDNLVVTRDDEGNVTGLSGFGNDLPVRALRTFDSGDGSGWYAAFLNNDPVEGEATTVDLNHRVMVTAVGAGDGRTLEIVQAVLEPYQYLPPVPPAAITLLGPDPQTTFDNGSSNAQSHTGADCGVAGGDYAPIVGTVGSAATDHVQDNLNRPENFESGPFDGTATVGDLTNGADPIVGAAGHGTIDTFWTECNQLKELIERLIVVADYYCNTDLETCTIPATTPASVVVIDGDLTNTPSGQHYGILVVTGELVYNGNTAWDGVIMAVGEGDILRDGGGNGNPNGGVIMANIDPTPNGARADKSDWCANDFMPAHYETQGGGNATVQWCSNVLEATNSIRTYKVQSFVQR